MNTTKLVTMISCIVLTNACAIQPTINFDKNTEIDTSQYKTFVWLNETKILAPVVDFNPVMKVRVDNAIEAAFINKGYQLIEDPEKADFSISYSVGNREMVQVHNYPRSYGGNFNWGARYHHGRHSTVLVTNETHIVPYTEGKLAIDVYDVKSHQPAWHGWATKRLSSGDKESPSASIKMIVDQLVATFN